MVRTKQIVAIKEEIKKLPIKEKIAKFVELKQLQEQVRTLCNQEIKRNQETSEEQAEAERVTGLLQPMEQRIHKLT